ASKSSLTTPVVVYHTTAPTHLYTPSLHDALPISPERLHCCGPMRMTTPLRASPEGQPSSVASSDLTADPFCSERRAGPRGGAKRDRKSTRLNSSHVSISYAVFCLKKKNSRVRVDA